MNIPKQKALEVLHSAAMRDDGLNRHEQLEALRVIKDALDTTQRFEALVEYAAEWRRVLETSDISVHQDHKPPQKKLIEKLEFILGIDPEMIGATGTCGGFTAGFSSSGDYDD